MTLNNKNNNNIHKKIYDTQYMPVLITAKITAEYVGHNDLKMTMLSGEL